ncbi:MAG: tellurite resistance TerB family protein [Coleofasciculaceae cyanobacterium SM2_1_6]|nr:tellurite resistance TerB family protein [Coleofasciculaceae cyanobacterium SM2_1_6]
MGLFDKVFGAKEVISDELSPAEAYAAIALGAIAADGYLSDEESHGVSFMLSRTQLFKNYSNDVLRRMFDKLLGILKRKGLGSLVDAAKKSLPYEMRESAFAVATDLIFADGMVTDDEQSFLNQLYEALEIKPEVALNIVQVMAIKNRS